MENMIIFARYVIYGFYSLQKMRLVKTLCMGLAILLRAASVLWAQNDKFDLYLQEDQLPDLIQCLPAPPEEGSAAFTYDLARYQWGKSLRSDPLRAAMAQRDAVWTYDALIDELSVPFGMKVSAEATPEIWRLLCGGLASVDPIRVHPKAFFHRRRPFEVMDEATMTGEDDNLRGEGSYPSGHTTRGWLAALMMAEINPAAANDIYKRAWEYGQSRVIAGAHWQSDVDISRVGSAIGYSRLQGSPLFQARMALAKEEFRRLKYPCTAEGPKAGAAGPESLPEGGREYFVSLESALPDAILEIRYHGTYNFVGTRIDGYLSPTALLTRTAADSLRKVSDYLISKGYRLKIYDAYRPQAAVDHFVRWAAKTADVRMKPYFYPDLDKSVLFKQDYIMEKSGHTRGSTVDLTIFDMASGKEVDMGGTFDWFGIESHPDYGGDPDKGVYTARFRDENGRMKKAGISRKQFENRMILREAMIRFGFKPLDSEWWHFTLRNEPFPDTYFNFPVR